MPEPGDGRKELTVVLTPTGVGRDYVFAMRSGGVGSHSPAVGPAARILATEYRQLVRGQIRFTQQVSLSPRLRKTESRVEGRGRWDKDNAEAVVGLGSLYYSDLWPDYWSRQRPHDPCRKNRSLTTWAQE